jgi:cytochrome c551/c552
MSHLLLTQNTPDIRSEKNVTTIHFRIRRPSSTDIEIDETPGFRKGENESPVFTRTFKVSGLNHGEQLLLHLQEDKLASAKGFSISGGDFSQSGKSITNDNNYSLEGDITLSDNELTRLEISYVPLHLREHQIQEKRHDSTKIDVAVNQQEILKVLEQGKRLLEMSDCAACHTMDNKAIGPSFRMIADKYGDSHEVIETLAKKIITGGTGVWGRQMMTAHPNVTTEHAASMVKYILSLDSTSGRILKNGLAANFYKPGIQLSRIPDFIPGQKPNLSVTVPDVEFVGIDMSINRETNDFFDFDDQFVMYLSGFMNISQPGKYEFRLKANAGARFILNGKKIADVNYTNYDYREQEVTAELKRGSTGSELNIMKIFIPVTLVSGGGGPAKVSTLKFLKRYLAMIPRYCTCYSRYKRGVRGERSRFW